MSELTPAINGLPVINPRAAGMDIGSRFHVVAVPSALSDQPIQTFQAFTADLKRMADWLVGVGIKSVVIPLRQNSCRLKFLNKIKFEIRDEILYKVYQGL